MKNNADGLNRSLFFFCCLFLALFKSYSKEMIILFGTSGYTGAPNPIPRFGIVPNMTQKLKLSSFILKRIQRDNINN
jgi:hypothetical protein